MRTIQTVATVTKDGRLTVEVPREIQPGTHRVLIMFDETHVGGCEPPPFDFPVHDSGPWPEGLSLRREDMYDDWGR